MSLASSTLHQISKCQIEGNEMEHGIQDSWRNDECIQNILIKPKEKGPLERPKCKFKDNTKIHENVKWVTRTPGGYA